MQCNVMKRKPYRSEVHQPRPSASAVARVVAAAAASSTPPSPPAATAVPPAVRVAAAALSSAAPTRSASRCHASIRRVKSRAPVNLCFCFGSARRRSEAAVSARRPCAYGRGWLLGWGDVGRDHSYLFLRAMALREGDRSFDMRWKREIDRFERAPRTSLSRYRRQRRWGEIGRFEREFFHARVRVDAEERSQTIRERKSSRTSSNR